MKASELIEPGNRSLLEFCVANDIDQVVVAADECRVGIPLKQLLDVKQHGPDVIELLSFFEREQGKLPLDIPRPEWLIYSELPRATRGKFWYHWMGAGVLPERSVAQFSWGKSATPWSTWRATAV